MESRQAARQPPGLAPLDEARVVIVAGKPVKDVPPGAFGAIVKQARLKP